MATKLKYISHANCDLENIVTMKRHKQFFNFTKILVCVTCALFISSWMLRDLIYWSV
jgi:hypothetical protein